jgi:hypothetical protein
MLKENQEQVVEPVSPLQLKHQNLKLQKNPRQLQLKYVLTSKINTGSVSHDSFICEYAF